MDPLIAGIVKTEKLHNAESGKRLKLRISKAMEEARSLTAGFQRIDPVDVVELAALPRQYKERIIKKGLVLYDLQKS